MPLTSDEAIKRQQQAEEVVRLERERFFSECNKEEKSESLRDSFRDFLASEIGPEAWSIDDSELDEMLKASWGIGGYREQGG